MSDGRVILRRDGLLAHLRSVADDHPGHPDDPVGLVLVSGGIVRRNLEERMADEGIPGDLVRITTIEDLARDRVGRSRGDPATVLDRPIREHAVESVLESARGRDTPLGAFARRVPWQGGEVLSGVESELDEFYRCTDAGDDAEELHAVVDEVAPDRPFAAEATRENLRAFAALDDRLDELTGDRFVSRSHLVRAARSATDAWTATAGDPEWVALATVSAVDNPTLRFLATIASFVPLHLFAGAGTAPTLDARLRSSAVPVDVERGPDGATGDADGEGGVGAGRRLLAAAADHREVTVGDGDGVRAAAVPDRRREVEFALRDARRRRQAGETALVVAPEAGEYETPVEDVSLTTDQPTYVETRREVRNLSAFRAVAATLRVLASAAGTVDPERSPGEPGDDAVSPGAILAPLRAGFCLPRVEVGDPRNSGGGADPATVDGGDEHAVLPGEVDPGTSTGVGPGTPGAVEWPLPTSTLREVAGGIRSRSPRPLEDWRADLPDDGAFAPVQSYLAWVEEYRERPPEDGAALGDVVASLVGAVARSAARRDLPSFGGVAVDPDRARVAAKHPTYYAGLVRATGGAADAYDWLRSTLCRPTDWSTAATAVDVGLGAESYGLPDDDAGAVPVVDAGNAHYRRADRVYVLGLAAERFPRPPRRDAFLHRAVREAVHRRAAERPFLYLNGEATQYERDLDAYEAALRAGGDGVTIVWPYKDEEGRDRPRSPFLDAVTVVDGARTRVDLGDWMALAEDPDWDAVIEGLAPKERLRLLARYAGAPPGRGPPEDRLRALASSVDAEDADRVLDGIDRFGSLTGDDDD